jgi:hypothetical protein
MRDDELLEKTKSFREPTDNLPLNALLTGDCSDFTIHCAGEEFRVLTFINFAQAKYGLLRTVDHGPFLL